MDEQFRLVEAPNRFLREFRLTQGQKDCLRFNKPVSTP